MNRRVLLIEDEPGLVLTLTDRLVAEGFEVESRQDGEAGLRASLDTAFDIILLDVMLPRLSGLEVCRRIRQEQIETPILMLTARGQLIDKVVGLQIGADDYLTKPFEMPELLARMEALLRRSSRAPANRTPAVYHFGPASVNFKAGEVMFRGALVQLSAREFQLLRYLIEHRDVVVSRDELLKEVWGYDAMPSTRTVDVHMAWLRQKVEEDAKHPRYILTLRGLGYKFQT